LCSIPIPPFETENNIWSTVFRLDNSILENLLYNKSLDLLPTPDQLMRQEGFGVPISNWRCMMFIIERWRLTRTSSWMHYRRNNSSVRRKRSPTSSMGM